MGAQVNARVAGYGGGGRGEEGSLLAVWGEAEDGELRLGICTVVECECGDAVAGGVFGEDGIAGVGADEPARVGGWLGGLTGGEGIGIWPAGFLWWARCV